VAHKLGLTPQDILEAIEIALPEAGVVVCQHGFDAWRETAGSAGLEPSQVPDGTRQATHRQHRTDQSRHSTLTKQREVGDDGRDTDSSRAAPGPRRHSGV
jgi:hypothetical protein